MRAETKVFIDPDELHAMVVKFLETKISHMDKATVRLCGNTCHHPDYEVQENYMTVKESIGLIVMVSPKDHQ